MAISITLVGVAVFSEIRKSKVSTAKEQMSIPDPAIDENMPPRNPVTKSAEAFQLIHTYEPKLPEVESSCHMIPDFHISGM